MSANDISVVPVRTRSQLRRFARFNVQLYKGNPYAVPDLIGDTVNSFTPSRNAAFEFCEAQAFLAFRGRKLVGRVAAIINHKANDAWKVKTVRFGWIDFIDDIMVTQAMLDVVAAWGRERGMDRLEGPFGFTDFDPEGMLTDGFDRLGTMATIYNYPYYSQHMGKLGLQESAQWVEWHIPYNTLPDKMERIGKVVMERYNLHLAPLDRSIREEARQYAYKLFDLVNEAYSQLYGYSAFSRRQIEDFVRRYLPLLDKRLAVLVLDSNNELVAGALTMTSIALALHKAQGRLFPFGWWHIIKALKIKRSDTVEMLFIAVKPEYQNRGINAIPFTVLNNTLVKMGYKHGESNPELVTNMKMQSQWSYYQGVEIVRRRAVFYKMI